MGVCIHAENWNRVDVLKVQSSVVWPVGERALREKAQHAQERHEMSWVEVTRGLLKIRCVVGGRKKEWPVLTWLGLLLGQKFGPC